MIHAHCTLGYHTYMYTGVIECIFVFGLTFESWNRLEAYKRHLEFYGLQVLSYLTPVEGFNRIGFNIIPLIVRPRL